MPVQSLLWTALPNGLAPDGRARLSVLVSPRLEPGDAPPRLASFPDLRRWPATLAGATFTVRADTRTVTLGAADLDATLGTPDPAAWDALFGDDTPVRGFEFHDRTDDRVLSYDAAALDKVVRDLWARFAVRPELPTLAELGDDDTLRPVVDAVRMLDRHFTDANTRQRDVVRQLASWRLGYPELANAPGIVHALATFQLFHTPGSRPTTQTFAQEGDPRTAATWRTHAQARIDEATAVAAIDFHAIVAAMNQFPTLLRRLGLVLDLAIPRAALDAGADVPLSVHVELPPPAPEPEEEELVVKRRTASAVTRTRHDRATFAPAPRPDADDAEARLANGLLRLDGGWALLQADVDGSVHKLMNLARTLAAHHVEARQLDPVSKLPRTAGLPALRTAGLMLVHTARGAALSAAMKRSAASNAVLEPAFDADDAAAPALWAEDLVRGWRVDVHDAATGRWRSLCERDADYVLGGGAVTLRGVREEGTVRLAATVAADGSDPDVVRLHEAATVWSGWSLVAPPPGRAVDRDDMRLRDAAADVPDGIPLRTAFTVAPGTLPRLRYGRSYAVRVRAVDLAGNSLPPSLGHRPGDDAAVTAPTPFLRHEPVEPPAIALVRSDGAAAAPEAGESMLHLAVRTFNAVFDDATPSAQVARRWGVAARTSAREAELHGALDGPRWGGADQYALLVERDRDLPSQTFELRGPLAAPGGEVKSTRYAVLDDDAEIAPYLADPLCTRIGARLLRHPLAEPNAIIPIPLYPDGRAWPDAAPFRIRVYEGAAGEVPDFDEASRTLLVPTPKGVRAALRLSATLDDAALGRLGVWHWIPAAERTPALRRQARTGRLWALTPWRELDVVHAVQRPLLRPTMTELLLDRPPGATWVRPGIDARVHRATTDRVALHARWHDPRDAAGTAEPSSARRDDVAFTVRITDPQGYGGAADHVLPDPADENRIALGGVKAALNVGEATHPRIHEFGDTRYRRIEYHLVATSRFREYMPTALLAELDGEGNPIVDGDGRVVTTDAHLTVAGPVERRWVPSAAPPPAPEVLYVVPTFGWTRGADANGRHTSWRRGGGLRIWLDRPWNASGFGEMLAVVLPPAGASIDPNDGPYRSTVTQWGNDLAWKSPFVNGPAPALRAFPRARTAADPSGAWLPPGAPPTEADQPAGSFPTTNLSHPGLSANAPTGRVDVAPHDVHWDPDRRLWYCDVEIDAGGAYFPFVRLALARYQPVSVTDAHLSNVVLADFAMLAPDRWLTVTRGDATRRQVRVHGFSHTRSAGYDEAWPHRTVHIGPAGNQVERIPTGISPTNVVEVWLEELPAGASEDFGWRRIADGVPAPVRRPVLTPSRGVATAPSASAQRSAAAVDDARRARQARDLVRARDYERVVAESLLETTAEWPTLWSGALTLPATRPAGSRWRAVVAEYEEYLADGPDPYERPLDRKARRLVFVEHVELG